MENKNLGIVATLITTFLCGIPGIASLCFGVVVALAGPVFDNPNSDLLFIISFICLGVIFVSIPIVVGVFTLRNRSSKSSGFSQNEPIPPPN